MKKRCQTALALLLALASTLSLLLVAYAGQAASCFLFFVRDTLGVLSGQAALAALVWAALSILYARTLAAPPPWQRGDRLKLLVLDALFAAVAAVSAAYRTDAAAQNPFGYPYWQLLALGKAVGFFALVWLGMRALLQRLPRWAKRLPAEPEPAPDVAALRRGFFLAWGAILVAWFPALLLSYPGALSVDAGRALQQFTGEIPWTADHPPAYTLLLGSVVWLGAQVGGDNFGLFAATLIQALFLSGVMAYSVRFLRREGVPAAPRRVLVVLYALLPLSMENAPHLIKDVPYAAAFFAYCLTVAQAFLHPEAALRSRRWWAMTLLFALLTLLLRHNGVLAVAPTTLVLGVALLRQAGPGARRRLRAGLLLAPLLCWLGFNSLIVPRFASQPESTPDVLGVTFQQTARILANAPEEVSDADRAAIDRLLDVDALAASYTPTGSDAVRKTFRYNNGHTGADVADYLAVWARLSLRHPLTAFHAFWSLSGGFLDPFRNDYAYVSTMPEETSAKYPHTFHFAHPDAVLALQPRWDSALESYRMLPPIALLSSVGLYAWLLALGGYLVSRTRARKLGWLLLPPGMALLSCLFSAGYQTGGRYTLPVVYTAPFLLCLLSVAALRATQSPIAGAGVAPGQGGDAA